MPALTCSAMRADGEEARARCTAATNELRRRICLIAVPSGLAQLEACTKVPEEDLDQQRDVAEELESTRCRSRPNALTGVVRRMPISEPTNSATTQRTARTPERPAPRRHHPVEDSVWPPPVILEEDLPIPVVVHSALPRCPPVESRAHARRRLCKRRGSRTLPASCTAPSYARSLTCTLPIGFVVRVHPRVLRSRPTAAGPTLVFDGGIGCTNHLSYILADRRSCTIAWMLSSTAFLNAGSSLRIMQPLGSTRQHFAEDLVVRRVLRACETRRREDVVHHERVGAAGLEQQEAVGVVLAARLPLKSMFAVLLVLAQRLHGRRPGGRWRPSCR